MIWFLVLLLMGDEKADAQASEAIFGGQLGSFDALRVNPSHQTASVIG